MNEIDSIYTTVSEGKVHIAADTKYIGSVDSYNYCFTQFFAWLFSYSMTVNFDGKEYSVNKESYTNLIRSLTKMEEISDICSRSMFRPVAETAKLPISFLKMRDVIAISDRKALFKKLALAISQGDTQRALLMIGKGADLDTAYYDRDWLSPSFISDTSGLDLSKYTFTVFRAAPILQAARKGNIAVCKFLEEAGANLSVRGKEYTFNREITNVSSHLEFVAEPRWIPHHYHTKDLDGHCHDDVHYRMGFRPELRERTIVHTQDSRSNEENYQLSGEKNYQLEQVDFGKSRMIIFG